MLQFSESQGDNDKVTAQIQFQYFFPPKKVIKAFFKVSFTYRRMVQLSKEISIYNSKVNPAFIQPFRIKFNFHQKPNRGADKVIFYHQQLKRVIESVLLVMIHSIFNNNWNISLQRRRVKEKIELKVI